MFKYVVMVQFPGTLRQCWWASLSKWDIKVPVVFFTMILFSLLLL